MLQAPKKPRRDGTWAEIGAKARPNSAEQLVCAESPRQEKHNPRLSYSPAPCALPCPEALAGPTPLQAGLRLHGFPQLRVSTETGAVTTNGSPCVALVTMRCAARWLRDGQAAPVARDNVASRRAWAVRDWWSCSIASSPATFVARNPAQRRPAAGRSWRRSLLPSAVHAQATSSSHWEEQREKPSMGMKKLRAVHLYVTPQLHAWRRWARPQNDSQTCLMGNVVLEPSPIQPRVSWPRPLGKGSRHS